MAVPSVRERAEQVRAALLSKPELRKRPEFVKALKDLDELLERDPLQSFVPHAGQVPWFEASTPLVAAFAGNRFGKTTSLVVRALIECVDRDSLPRSLQPFKRWDETTAPRGTFVRMVNPSFQLLEGVLLPAFREWAPKDQLLGGSFDKAYQGAPNRLLRFANGSSIQFMTYEMDLDKFGGWKGHVVGFDEPPPQNIREECLGRLVDFDGYELFAMTPLKANTGWIRREIFKKREDPGVTVVRGSIHDNPTLSTDAKERFLGALSSDLWRRAREFGDFVDVGGLIFPEWERCVVPPPPPAAVRSGDVVVSIDPGVRNCGIAFCVFGRDNIMGVFDELLLQDETPTGYVDAIDATLKRWGVPRSKVEFVIDPASRQRAQVNAETVESALMRLGVYTTFGQNDVEAGIQQLRDRMASKTPRFWCSEDARFARDQADEYAAEDREDGQFKVIKRNDHVLDAIRYAAMHRPWFPMEEQNAPAMRLGWTPDTAPPERLLAGPSVTGPPMGSLS